MVATVGPSTERQITMAIRDRIRTAIRIAGEVADKLGPFARDIERARVLQAEGDRLRALYGEWGFDDDGRWAQLSGPEEDHEPNDLAQA